MLFITVVAGGAPEVQTGHRHFYYCAIKSCPGRFKALLLEVAVSVVKEASNLTEEIV